MLRTITRLTIALSAIFWACAQAQAQNTLTFTAATTTGDGSVVPALTWSTTPSATGCTASGTTNWTGAKGAAGTTTLPAITSTTTYNLLCTWPADTQAIASWVNATQNTDGSSYTDPLSVRLKWTFAATLSAGPTCAAGETCVNVSSPTNTFTITGLTPPTNGTMTLVAYSQNQRMVFSTGSMTATKTFSAGTQTKSVGITVNPVGNPPSSVTLQ